MIATALITHPRLDAVPRRAAELLTRSGHAMTFDAAIDAAADAPADAVIVRAVLDTIDRGTLWAETIDGNTLDHDLAHTHITDAELHTTFGRQWRQMITFLTRATTLTGEQMHHLTAAAAAFELEASMLRPVPLPLVRASLAAVHAAPGFIETADTLDRRGRDAVALAVHAAATIVFRHHTVPYAPHPAALRPNEVHQLAGPWQHAVGILPRPF